MLTVTPKGVKFLFSLFITFKGCTCNKICSLACEKAKTENKENNKICQGQNQFEQFWWPTQNMNKLNVVAHL